MKTLALYSIKGGVGKTSTAVNLAHAAAEDGARVLLWDLDPQSAATWTLRVRPRVPGGAGKLLRRRRPLRESLLASDHPRIDLLPASLALRKLDRRLSRMRRSRERLRRRLDELRGEVDLVLLDCPPGLTLLAENVFEASDALLVPLIPAPLSLRTLEQLRGFLDDHDWRHQRILSFLSMVDRRKSLHRDTLRTMPTVTEDMLSTWIPAATEVERMGVHRAPVAAFAPASSAARAYQRLYAELRPRLWGAEAGLDRGAGA